MTSPGWCHEGGPDAGTPSRLAEILVAEALEIEGDSRVGPVGRRFGRRRPELEICLDGAEQPDVVALLLREIPLLLEYVAIGLDEVAARTDRAGDAGKGRPVDIAKPASGGVVGIDRLAGVPAQPGGVLVEVVEEQSSLPLERPDLRPPLQLPNVKPPRRDRHPKADP